MSQTNLYAALLAAQKDMPAIQKKGINPHLGAKHVKLEDLIPPVLEILNNHGIIVTQSPGFGETGDARLVAVLRTRLTHAESGEFVEDSMLLNATKDDPQGHGAAITYARRYSLMSILGLVADTDEDAERPARSRSAGGPSARSRTGRAQAAAAPAAGAESEGSPPAESHFRAPASVVATDVDTLAKELEELLGKLGAKASLPKVEEKREAGDAAWLKRNIATAKRRLTEKEAE